MSENEVLRVILPCIVIIFVILSILLACLENKPEEETKK